jgi:hypothetical protein
MSDDDIDLDRVIADPKYRRQVIEFLNGTVSADGAEAPAKNFAASASGFGPET